ncbi:hypothetical protein A3F06_01415 [candidate division TM6 bacterium RIFCSPHIGHO2_12_FULL_36_22]|nr:MAG: hypothetical protein A3F06_01415 [candidate division TM6 bacterium RIFCSPHIGHO2_12_FULL_36_22]
MRYILRWVLTVLILASSITPYTSSHEFKLPTRISLNYTSTDTDDDAILTKPQNLLLLFLFLFFGWKKYCQSWPAQEPLPTSIVLPQMQDASTQTDFDNPPKKQRRWFELGYFPPRWGESIPMPEIRTPQTIPLSFSVQLNNDLHRPTVYSELPTRDLILIPNDQPLVFPSISPQPQGREFFSSDSDDNREIDLNWNPPTPSFYTHVRRRYTRRPRLQPGYIADNEEGLKTDVDESNLQPESYHTPTPLPSPRSVTSSSTPRSSSYTSESKHEPNASATISFSQSDSEVDPESDTDHDTPEIISNRLNRLDTERDGWIEICRARTASNRRLEVRWKPKRKETQFGWIQVQGLNNPQTGFGWIPPALAHNNATLNAARPKLQRATERYNANLKLLIAHGKGPVEKPPKNYPVRSDELEHDTPSLKAALQYRRNNPFTVKEKELKLDEFRQHVEEYRKKLQERDRALVFEKSDRNNQIIARYKPQLKKLERLITGKQT